MSYEPLHHKYRPQTFADLVGQEAIATTLSNALNLNKIAPAYLFAGPRGTGKTSSARILAKSLNCLKSDRPTDKPCGVCEVCRSIINGSSLDVIEIDAASNTGVDNIRELIERAQFAPVQCRHKVYIIDECHSLSASSFNALLKTLEEPPSHVVFVLATTDPQRVLPTIISRCQRFDFRRIPLEAMVQHLQDIAGKESININREAVLTVAQIAQGGLRDAESMLDQLSLLPGEVTIAQVWNLVGAVPEQDLMQLLQAIAADNPEAVLDRVRAIMDRGREPLVVLQNLTSFYRDLLIAKTAGDRADLVAITPATWVQLRQFAQTQDVGKILQGQQHLRACEAQIKNTTQPRLWLEVALLGLLPSALNATQQIVASPSPRAVSAPPVAASPTPATPVSQPQTGERFYGQSPAVAATPAPQTIVATYQPKPEAPAPQVPNGPTDLNDLQSLWQQVLAHLTPLSQALLKQHGKLIYVQEHEVRLGFRSQELIKIAAEPKLPQIKQAFAQVLGRAIQVHLEVSGSSATPAPATNQPVQVPFSKGQQPTAPVQPQAVTQAFTPTAAPTATEPKIQPITQPTTQSVPVPEVRSSLPTQTSTQTTPPVLTATVANGQESVALTQSRTVAKPAIPPSNTPVNSPANHQVSRPQQPTRMVYVDESEAIAAAQKLADMFGGTVVADFEDSDSFYRDRIEQSSEPMDEISLEVEDFSDAAEEVVETSAMPQPLSWAENGRSANNFMPTDEQEEAELLSGLVSEEYGGLEF
jgi:DNA polymerase-3 subunit gamma/tau